MIAIDFYNYKIYIKYMKIFLKNKSDNQNKKYKFLRLYFIAKKVI